MVFTTSSTASFGSFKQNDILYKDAKLSIYFETQEMMEDTLILLRFNCPDGSCDYIASGWSDLKLHVRGVHGNLIWYECSPLTPESGCGLNHVQTAIFASVERKYSPTNTQRIPPTCSHTTCHPFNYVGNPQNRKVSRLMLIRCASFVRNVRLATTNCTHTCGRNTKNVLSANEKGLCMNSGYASYDT